MNVHGTHYRTIWMHDPQTVRIIDQTRLPHEFVCEDLRTVEDAATAISEMHVRGAGLIGATTGWGMYLAALHAPRDGFDAFLREAGERLQRPHQQSCNQDDRQIGDQGRDCHSNTRRKATFQRSGDDKRGKGTGIDTGGKAQRDAAQEVCKHACLLQLTSLRLIAP